MDCAIRQSNFLVGGNGQPLSSRKEYQNKQAAEGAFGFDHASKRPVACKTRTCAASLRRKGCNKRLLEYPLVRIESIVGKGVVQKNAKPRKDGVQAQALAKSPPAVVETNDSHTLRGLFPSSSSHKQGYVKVSDLHTIYYEVFGNPQGKPAVFLHGGPGAGCTANHSRFFDPEHYRIVLFDQRGCGKSTPRGCLEENNTWELVEDLEKLRKELSIEKWLVVGGSWGTTLALAYAQTHPKCVSAMVLRAVCMMRKREIDWFYRQGADALFPFAWDGFVAHIPEEERDDLLAAYYRRLTSDDKQTAEAAAKSWLRWEMSLLSFSNMPVMISWDGKEYKTLPMPAAASSPPAAATPSASEPAAQTASAPSNGSLKESDSAASNGSSKESSSALSNGSSKKSSISEAGSPSTSASTAVKDKEEVTKSSEGGNGSPSQAASVTENTSGSNGVSKSQSNETEQKEGSKAEQNGRLKSEGSSEKEEGKGEGKEEGSNSAEQRSSGDNMKGGTWMSSSLAQARLESHYSMNGAFFLEDQLLKGVDRIRSIPTVAVQGRYDFVCPLKTAYDLHSAWQEMELRVVPNAGHSQYEPGITHEIIEATEKFKSLE